MNPPRLLLPFTLLAGTSQAAIIHSGIKNILIPTTFVGIYIDIDGGGTVAEEGAGWDVNPFFGGEGIANSPKFHPVAATVALDAPVLKLSFGQTVDGSSTFASTYPGGFSSSGGHVGNGIGRFASGSEAYIGFSFNTNSNSGALYGWMRVALANDGSTGMIRDWAYDDTGSAITVGAVPEASLPCSLLLGSVIFCYRRRR